MITGLRPATFEKLQLNAGALLVGFSTDSAKNAAELKTAVLAALKAGTGVIGATRGGGTFTCVPEMRQIEADGMRYSFKGSTVNDRWIVKLTGTMIEITPENFQRALGAAELAKNGSVTTLRVRTEIRDEDYIPKLSWVGDTSKGFVLIELDNALNTTGASFTFTDKGEGTLPFEFEAHQANLEDQEYAPCRIMFFDEAA